MIWNCSSSSEGTDFIGVPDSSATMPSSSTLRAICAGGDRAGGLAVLHPVRLVDDQGADAEAGELVGPALRGGELLGGLALADDGVTDDVDVGVGQVGDLGAADDVRAHTGGELGELVAPVQHEARRADDDGREQLLADDGADRRDGLAEAHVVGDERPADLGGERRAGPLVRVHRGGEEEVAEVGVVGRGQRLAAPEDRDQLALQVREDDVGDVAEDRPQFIGGAHADESTYTDDERNSAR